MSTNRENKKAKVTEIREMFEGAKSAVLIDYIGITVEEADELRNQFRDANVNYKVLKNTMIQRAVDELGISGIQDHLAGPTAIAFSHDDPTAGARIIADFIKKNKKTEIKAGVLGTKYMTADGVKALSSLPTKEVMIGQLLSVMNGPIRGLATVLNGTTRGLVIALNAIKEQKESA